MSQFPGISAEALWLLAENRFQDSKAFYEEKKPLIWAGVVVPLRQLLSDLAPCMRDIDDRLVIHPNANGCISRVRRDNRFTRDKSMYRENMWIAFMRDKKAWEDAPGFYLDFSVRGAAWGMGTYWCAPAFLQHLRQCIDENPAAFEKAVRKAERAGFRAAGAPYSRPKKAVSPLLDGLYNRKGIVFEKQESTDFVSSPTLPDTLEAGFRALAPLYRLLIAAVESYRETA